MELLLENQKINKENKESGIAKIQKVNSSVQKSTFRE